jgi:small-conductance mechanosensitive channel
MHPSLPLWAALAPWPSWHDFLSNGVRDWRELIWPGLLLAGTVLLGYGIREVLFRLLLRWQSKSTHRLGEILIAALRGPIIIWSLIFGIYFAIESSRMEGRLEHVLSQSLFSLWIISFTIMFVHLAGSMVKYYGGRNTGDMPATSLTKNLAQIAAACIGAAILLHHLGISITPMLTALGVGGLAVALALQDTLGNLFGGFYITVAGQVRLGDYIKLNTNEEGYVTDISWRSTTIRTLTNNFIIVPNSKLAQAIVTNYNLPEKRMRISVQVGVSYAADPDHVEQILVEIAKQAMGEVAGLAPDQTPFARLNPGFGDTALQMQLYVEVDEFEQQFRIQHELRKRILKRFGEEKIEMPFPTQTILLKQ